jgi:hypothetical protein
MYYIYYRIKQLCIKLVIKTSLHYDARSEKHQIMTTNVVICTDMLWPSVKGVRDVKQDKKVEVCPLCRWRISRKINNLHIFKNTSLGIKCMGKFLPMFKEKKTTGILYTILLTIRQQLFWEVASAIRNVFTSFFRKFICQNVAFNEFWKHTSGIITK